MILFDSGTCFLLGGRRVESILSALLVLAVTLNWPFGFLISNPFTMKSLCLGIVVEAWLTCAGSDLRMPPHHFFTNSWVHLCSHHTSPLLFCNWSAGSWKCWWEHVPGHSLGPSAYIADALSYQPFVSFFYFIFFYILYIQYIIYFF